MVKPNVCVFISGDLIQREDAIKELKKYHDDYSVAICTGGGKQINQAFKERGFEVDFGPLGRNTKTLEERQLARDILEQNQARIQDLLDEHKVHARVFIPVWNIADVLCPMGKEVMLLATYIGYDLVLIFTFESRVREKEMWSSEIAESFNTKKKEKTRELNKIKVVGFKD